MTQTQYQFLDTVPQLRVGDFCLIPVLLLETNHNRVLAEGLPSFTPGHTESRPSYG